MKPQTHIHRTATEKTLGAVSRKQKVREKSNGCHNYKQQPIPDTKKKRKQTEPNKRKSNKRTKSTTIGSLLPKRGNRNAQWTENNDKTQHKSLRRKNHEATNSKTNTETTTLERSEEYTIGGCVCVGLKALFSQLAKFKFTGWKFFCPLDHISHCAAFPTRLYMPQLRSESALAGYYGSSQGSKASQGGQAVL